MMDVWVTRIEWLNEDSKLPNPSAEEPLKISVKNTSALRGTLQDIYQSTVGEFLYRTYEPGSTVPDWIGKVTGYEWCELIAEAKEKNLNKEQQQANIDKLKKKYE
jgi:hypothetical protein